MERVGTSLGLYIIPPLAARISWRRLVVRDGTSKCSTISQFGCSTFRELATKAEQQDEEDELGRHPVAVVQFTQFTHYTQNNTMEQNSQNGIYITIRIHKHDNKST
jgi:type IV secretory pathway ATPase VirB11/archaellum biosynthesis ATPase